MFRGFPYSTNLLARLSVLWASLAVLTVPAVVMAQYICTTNAGKITITQYTGGNGTVNIPTTINGLPVVALGYSAFYGCPYLTSISMGTNITSIEAQALGNCASLTAITVDTNNAVYSSVNGVLFDKMQKTLIQFPGGILGSYTIPASVTNVGDEAFQFCNLNGVVTGPGVASIGYWAFNACFNLASAVLGTNVTTIGYGAFCDCTLLGDVNIPDNVTSIGEAAFSWCPLTSVKIGSGVSSIGAMAFRGCAFLDDVTIGACVGNIGDEAFNLCTSLTSVYFLGNGPSLGGYGVFSGCVNPTFYYLPEKSDFGSTYCGFQSVLWKPQVAYDASFGVHTNRFGFTITNAGSPTIIVEACTNLIGGIWTPVSTNTLTSGSSYFSDPVWTNYPGRFYRFRLP